MISNHARSILIPARLSKIGPALAVLMVARRREIGAMVIVFLIMLAFVSVPAYAQSTRKMDARTALLIIDIQEFYFPGGAVPLDKPEAASRNVGRLVEKFRAEDRLVVHIGHNVAKEKAFHEDVMPRDGEKIFIKDEVSAFNGTDLEEYLRENKIDRLVICGMQTHMCVEGAVRAAYDLGFECILVGDACATRTLEFEDRSIEAAKVHDSTLSSLNGAYATVVDTETFLKTY